MLNGYLRRSQFPKCWKVAKLVLLPKSKKRPTDEDTFRPICLVDSTAKLFEAIIKKRLVTEIERTGDLADWQYGFRKGKSTIDALERVKEIARYINSGGYRHREFCVLITLDVKNAFNSASWPGIIGELERREVSREVIGVIKSYLQDRSVLVEGSESMEMRRGVPQGSVLGPTLWNIYYDGILRLPMPRKVNVVGYADDLALVVSGKNGEEIGGHVRTAMTLIMNWLTEKELTLAVHKTEAVIMVGRRTLTDLTLRVVDQEITTKSAIKYLGVYFDRNTRMTEHVKRTVQKAEGICKALTILMPNVGGPSSSKRKLIATVVYSTILYAAPIWGEACKYGRYREILQRIQRRMMMRVTSAYRTVSTVALQIIADAIPIDLMIKQKCREREEGTDDLRGEIVEIWQNRWNRESQQGQWTKRLIPNVSRWISRGHGQMDYQLTQVFSGHGSFQAYLKRFGKAEDDACRYCGEVDTAEHTIFSCPRWEVQRYAMFFGVGRDLTPENIVEEMISSEHKWNWIAQQMREIMRTKELEERQEQAGA